MQQERFLNVRYDRYIYGQILIIVSVIDYWTNMIYVSNESLYAFYLDFEIFFDFNIDSS